MPMDVAQRLGQLEIGMVAQPPFERRDDLVPVQPGARAARAPPR
jgi:hypothetical protein